MHVPSTRKSFGLSKPTLQAIRRLQRNGANRFVGMTCLHCRFERFGNDIQIITCCLGVFNSLLGCGIGVRCASVGPGSSPRPLAGGKDPVHHVNPVEEGVDHEHDWV